jgi:uncharacterized C2H2 Zn-finger protein
MSSVVYPCPVCDAVFRNEEMFVQHMQDHETRGER